MKRKTVLTIALSVCGAVVIGCGTYFAYKEFKPKSAGFIEVKVIDLDNVLIKHKTIEYQKDDSLTYLVKNNFNNVKIENGMVMSIESITTPADWSTFIAIYVNDVMSNYGINDLSFKNGDIISFINTVFVWNE